jgi:hypothetical protein
MKNGQFYVQVMGWRKRWSILHPCNWEGIIKRWTILHPCNCEGIIKDGQFYIHVIGEGHNKRWSILHPCNWEGIMREEDKFAYM